MKTSLIVFLFSTFLKAYFLQVVSANIEDGQIYGVIEAYSLPVDAASITPYCFWGMGVENCKLSNEAQLEFNASYYQSIQNPVITSESVDVFCLDWPFTVSYSWDSSITWDVLCDPVSAAYMDALNMNGLEIRLAQHRWAGDTGVVSCVMKREACEYESDGTMIGCLESSKYLAGYNLTIDIKPKTDGKDYWRNVVRCSVSVLEVNSLPTVFQTQIIMVDVSDEPYVFSILGLAIIIAGLFTMGCLVLRICRKDQCPICRKTMFLGIKRCWACRFYKAQPPPPALMHMIEHRQAHPNDWHIGPDPSYFSIARRLQQGGLKHRTKALCEGILRCLYYCCCCCCCFWLWRRCCKKQKQIPHNELQEGSLRSFYSHNSSVASANSLIKSQSTKDTELRRIRQESRIIPIAGSVSGVNSNRMRTASRSSTPSQHPRRSRQFTQSRPSTPASVVS